jgi:hypothetical protein
MLPGSMAQLLLVIMIVGVGVLLTITIRMKIARRNAAIPSAREQIEAIKAGSNARTDVDAIHASIHDIARTLSAQLDNKAERLEQLIVQADERIAQLGAATTQAKGLKPDASDSFAGTRTPTTAGRVKHEGTQANHQGTAAHKVQGPVAKPHATTAPAGSEREPEPTDALRRAIYALADGGRSPVEISRELDEHIGKIELILALRHG